MVSRTACRTRLVAWDTCSSIPVARAVAKRAFPAIPCDLWHDINDKPHVCFFNDSFYSMDCLSLLVLDTEGIITLLVSEWSS